jgi:hypothetical protein
MTYFVTMTLLENLLQNFYDYTWKDEESAELYSLYFNKKNPHVTYLLLHFRMSSLKTNRFLFHIFQ